MDFKAERKLRAWTQT